MEMWTLAGCVVFVLFLVIEARRERRAARLRQQVIDDADRRRRVAVRAFFGE